MIVIILSIIPHSMENVVSVLPIIVTTSMMFFIYRRASISGEKKSKDNLPA